MLGLILLIALACWCWIGFGPRFLRWPCIVVILLMTSGHQLGGMVAAYVEAFSEPALTLLIMFIGLMIILRGFGWRSRRRDYYRDEGWFRDRW
jgi:hypothetical protein